MKNLIYTIILTLILSTILSLSLFFRYDKEMYAYGLGCVFCTKQTMPFGISPKSGNYADGLVLVDDSDFELIGKGFKYQNASFKMADFLTYGYNDTSILVKCTDSLSNLRYLISYQTGYTSKKGNPEISFKELSKREFERVNKNYQWVELDKEKLHNITVKRTQSLAGVFISFFFLVVMIFRLQKVRQLK